METKKMNPQIDADLELKMACKLTNFPLRHFETHSVCSFDICRWLSFPVAHVFQAIWNANWRRDPKEIQMQTENRIQVVNNQTWRHLSTTRWCLTRLIAEKDNLNPEPGINTARALFGLIKRSDQTTELDMLKYYALEALTRLDFPEALKYLDLLINWFEREMDKSNPPAESEPERKPGPNDDIVHHMVVNVNSLIPEERKKREKLIDSLTPEQMAEAKSVVNSPAYQKLIDSLTPEQQKLINMFKSPERSAEAKNA